MHAIDAALEVEVNRRRAISIACASLALQKEAGDDGLLKFEADMRALGRPATLVWALEAPPGRSFTLHAEYAVGRGVVYIQALPGGGWRVGPSSPLRATTPMPS